jgi:charged multivesicular body protein 2A
MKGVTKAMMSMNNQMKLPEIQKIMMEFEKQTEMMDMKEEMMNDVIGKFRIIAISQSVNFQYF